MIEDKRIYFLRPVGQCGPVKIGCSSHCSRRHIAMMAWSPLPLEMVVTCVGGHALERRLHGIFAPNHSHLEWFHWSPALGDLMARLQAGEPIESLIDMNAKILPFKKAVTVAELRGAA